jgi:ribonuclease BN (tRNA processing enzyme)
MKVFAQVVGLETADSYPALMVVTDNQRVLFNCGEGLQRFAMEHRLKLVKLSAVLATRISMENLGGLPGMLLTLADMTAAGSSTQPNAPPPLTLCGGPGFSDFVFSFRHFLRRDDAALRVLEAPPPSPSSSSVAESPTTLSPVSFGAQGSGGEVTILPFLLQRATSTTSSTASTNHFPSFFQQLHSENPSFRLPLAHALLTPPPQFGAAASSSASDLRFRYPFNPLTMSYWPRGSGSPVSNVPVPRVMTPPNEHSSSSTLHGDPGSSSGGRVSSSTSCSQDDWAVCYLLSTATVPGKFYPQKATQQWGVKPGPAFGKLSKGEPVETALPLFSAGTLRLLATTDDCPADWKEQVQAALVADGGGAAGEKATAVDSAVAERFLAPGWHPRVLGWANYPPSSAFPAEAASAAASTSAAAPSKPAQPLIPQVRVTVKQSDVKDKDRRGATLLIVDIPSLDFLPSLKGHPDLNRALEANKAYGGGGGVTSVYHFTHYSIAATSEYQEWVREKFPASGSTAVPQVYLSRPPSVAAPRPILFCAQSLQQLKLHMLDPQAFTLPYPLPMTLGGTSGSGAAGGPSTTVRQAMINILKAKLKEGKREGREQSGVAGVQPASSGSAPAPSSAGAATGPIDIHATPLLIQRLIPLPAAGSSVASSFDSTASDPTKYNPNPTVTAAADVNINIHTLPYVMPPVTPGVAVDDLLEDARSVVNAIAAAGETGGAVSAVANPAEELLSWVERKMEEESKEAATSESSSPSAEATLPYSFRMVFTGTSSAIPSKYRNVSGIFVTPKPNASFVMDCGEGTYGQLTRRFGLTEEGGACSEALMGLEMIFISHLHADHHLGLLRLVMERTKAYRAKNGSDVVVPPLLIVGPTRLYSFLLEATAATVSSSDGAGSSSSSSLLLGKWRFADAEHFLHAQHQEEEEEVFIAGSAVATAAAPSLSLLHIASEGAGEPFLPTPADTATTGASDAAPVVVPTAAGGDESARLHGMRADVSGADWGRRHREAQERLQQAKAERKEQYAANASGSLKRKREEESSSGAAAAVGEGGGLADHDAKRARTGGGSSSTGKPDEVAVVADAEAPTCLGVAEEEDEDETSIFLGPAEVEECIPQPPCKHVHLVPLPERDDVKLEVATLMPRQYHPEGAAPVESASVSPLQAHLATPSFIRATFTSLGLRGIKTTRVHHCYKAYAVRVEGLGGEDEGSSSEKKPWSLVYSGDTRPCREVVYLGRNDSKRLLPVYPDRYSQLVTAAATDAASSRDGCSLLVHEATFEDTFEGRSNAVDKKHSTAGEAIRVGEEMGEGKGNEKGKCHNIVLTHFSARYPKVPVLPHYHNTTGAEGTAMAVDGSPTGDDDDDNNENGVIIAYDLMTLHGKQQQLEALPKLLPALHLLFTQAEGGGQELGSIKGDAPYAAGAGAGAAVGIADAKDSAAAGGEKQLSRRQAKKQQREKEQQQGLEGVATGTTA